MKNTSYFCLLLTAYIPLGLTSASESNSPSNTPSANPEGKLPIQEQVIIIHTSELQVPDTLINHNYYRLDPVTCKANNPEHTLLKSWTNRISFTKEKILIWGNICNDSPFAIPISDVKKELQISVDFAEIIYKGEHLVLKNDPPNLCENGLWCPVNPDAIPVIVTTPAPVKEKP